MYSCVETGESIRATIKNVILNEVKNLKPSIITEGKALRFLVASSSE